MKRYFVVDEDFKKERKNLKPIKNILGINEGQVKYYVDIDKAEVFKLESRSKNKIYNEFGQLYDSIYVQLEGTKTRTKQGDPAVNVEGRLYTIARIVASTAIPNPNFYCDIRHKDGNRFNNMVENLEWVSHRQLVQEYYDKRKVKKEKPITAESLLSEINEGFDWDSIIWSEG